MPPLSLDPSLTPTVRKYKELYNKLETGYVFRGNKLDIWHIISSFKSVLQRDVIYIYGILVQHQLRGQSVYFKVCQTAEKNESYYKSNHYCFQVFEGREDERVFINSLFARGVLSIQTSSFGQPLR